MVTLASILAIAVAAALIAIVPGPTVSLIIANSVRAGSKAGLMNIAGTQLGLVLMICIVGFGLESIMAVMAEWFFVLKMVGAAYLVYLGYKMITSNGSFVTDEKTKPPKIGYFWQGFFVLMANPKALLFYGAFIPQFVDPTGNAFYQTVVYGAVFMVVAGAIDAGYAIIAGRAAQLISTKRIRLAERVSGTMLIGGGLWMASLSKN